MNIEVIKNYLDKEGRIKAFPSKKNRDKRLIIYEYLATKFLTDRVYSEKK